VWKETIDISETMKNVEIIAENGDVILELSRNTSTQETRKILVLSTAMAFVSPVFAAMFDGRFFKGQSLSRISPPTISLPDDDPKSMILICKISHMQNAHLPKKLDIATFADLALVCDKYDCVNVVRPWAMVWAAQLINNAEAPKFEKLVLATCLLDLPDEFFKVTQSIIRDRSELLNMTTAMGECELLPVSLYECIMLAQVKAQAKAVKAVNSLLIDKTICDAAALEIGVFCQMLAAKNVWPLVQQSVLKIKNGVAATGFRRTSTTDKLSSRCKNHACHCKEDSLSSFYRRNRGITIQLRKIYDGIKGLCLDCLRKKASGEPKIECRVHHSVRGCLKYDWPSSIVTVDYEAS
jgi:hypothetical protein